ncbi:hypothetical protein [Pseudonocardia sp.]|uniref:hypothetical protein n=1 Tax=Pseudonocardia sp. TaxID=60912 RepID=UPI003D13CD03
MLLLVLILVLAAFALLVVALVQGSVLWAWLSVAVSVAAASVLLVDWWQRQQAARDDEELPPPAPTHDPAGGPGGMVAGASGSVRSADYDSVTEFIPVTPQVQGQATGSVPPDGETRFLAQEQPGAPGEPSANEQTVLLPVARPPGSVEQPPGAVPGTPPWSASPSQSVTAGGPPAGPPDWSGGPSHGEETVVRGVDGEARPAYAEQPADPTDGPPGPPVAPEDPDGPTGLFVAAPDAAAVSGSSASQAAQAGQASERSSDQAQAGDGPDRRETGAPGVQQPAGQDPAGEAAPDLGAVPPPGPDGEPPEEPHDPVAASVAASAEDEVVVVDERPRYHVEGCSFLAGRPVIPLPAREAVELGFSACGWCRPNLLLARRHQPAAR